MAEYFVEIRPLYDDASEAVHRIGPLASERAAERCERGALMNMNRDRFCTVIVDGDGNEA